MLHVNALASLAELTLPYISVSERDLEAIYSMSQHDPACVACSKLYHNSIATDALDTALPFPQNPQIIQHVMERYWRDFAVDLLANFMRFGFSPFFIMDVEVDGSMDEEWMREFREERDAKQSGYMTTVGVPVVPAYGSWRTVICQPQPLRPALMSFARQDSAFFLFDKPNGSAGAQKNPILHTVSYSNRAMPRLDGSLQSSLAALLKSYTSLAQFEKFATMAAYTRAHPPIIVQHQPKEFKLDEAVIQRTFADSDISPIVQAEQYKVQMGGMANIRDTQDAFGRGENKPHIAVGLYSDPTRALSMDTMLTHPAQDAIFPLPPNILVAPQPPLPVEPADLPLRTAQHIQYVCAVLNVPVAMVQASVNHGGRGADIAEFEQTQFTRAVTAEQQLLKARLEDVFAFIMEKRVELNLKTHAHADMATLMTLFEIGAIPRGMMHREALRKVGLVLARGDKQHTADAADPMRAALMHQAQPPDTDVNANKKRKTGGG